MNVMARTEEVATIAEEIIAIVSKHRQEKIDSWSTESTLEDLDIDSFDFVELVFMLEDRYGIDIEYNANQTVNELKTLGDVARKVQELIVTKAAG